MDVGALSLGLNGVITWSYEVEYALYTLDSKKLEYGPGTNHAGFPSSPGCGVWTVIFQLSGFYCKSSSTFTGSPATPLPP